MNISFAAGQRRKTKAGLGEYQAYFINPTDKLLWGVGNIQTRGGNQIGNEAVPVKVVVTPSTLQFKDAFGALHGGAAIDQNGFVWGMGENNQGQLGVGDTNAYFVGKQITTDINGNPFSGVKSMAAFFYTPNQNGGWLCVKEDGTLWGWGQLRGLKGDGTDVATNVLRPTQVTIPGGRLAKMVVCGYHALLLCTDGTVWSWGNANSNTLGNNPTGTQYRTLRQITTLSNITYIAGGILWNYAVKSDGTLYGWGDYSGHMCKPNGNFDPIPTPIPLTVVTSVTGNNIVKIVTSSCSTYMLMSDGQLWAWGGNECGTIGNGEELQYDPDLPNYSGQNFGWNFQDGQLVVRTPYNVAPTRRFIDIFGSSVFTYYTYALENTGQLYSWGRNKGSILSNRVINAGFTINAHFANAWDLAWPTPVNPFNIPSGFTATCPYCVTHPSFDVCPEYVVPANTAPVANAGPDQNIGTATQASLTGSSSTDNIFVMKYLWTQSSGPNTAVIDLPGSPTPIVSGLISGTYVFQLKVTDNGWLTNTDTVSITKT